MKICTVVGTRPEIIRLSKIISLLDKLSGVEHILVHTGQNYDPNLSDVFFRDLTRQPDHFLDVRSSQPGEQIGQILVKFEALIKEIRPDKLLILGDTNSALCSIVAKKYGVYVYHMEAGNRCFDERVPEEFNRRLVDQASDILLPYTQNSKDNLLREGFALKRIFVTGNPIKEVLLEHEAAIEKSSILAALKVKPQGYFLATIHRAENVDKPERLEILTQALSALSVEHGKPIIISTHPRTRSKLTESQLQLPGLRYSDPFAFADFVHLEKKAALVITDSGTVQEECNIFGIPNVTVRDCTERPETVEAGSNIFVGCDREAFQTACAFALADKTAFGLISDYEKLNVSSTVVRILLSKEIAP